MAAYYLDEADVRGVPIHVKVQLDRGGRKCSFVFDDPTDLISQLEQTWGTSRSAGYAGRLRALHQQVAQVQRRSGGGR